MISDVKIKRFFTSPIVISVIMILIGLVLIFSPESALHVICTVAGALFLAWGISAIVYVIVKKIAQLGTILPSVVLVGLGLWLVFTPKSAVNLLMVIFGIVLVTQAVTHAFRLKFLVRGSKLWWTELVIASVIGILALLVLINPFGSCRVLMILAGIDLLIGGISSIVIHLQKRADARAEEEGKEEYYF